MSFPYEIIANQTRLLAVNLNNLKIHLKLPCKNDVDDPYLTELVLAVTKYAENYTRRTFINTKFRTYRGCFSCDYIEIRKSKLQSVESIKYWKDDALTLVDSAIYYTTVSNDYSSIVLKHNENWPTDEDTRLQAVQIEFTAGYGLDHTSIPDDLTIALKQHCAALYENRGDCDQASIDDSVPNTVRQIYNMNKIQDITSNIIIC